MAFLKSLSQKSFSTPSEALWFYPAPTVADETGAVAVVPSSGSDDELTAKQYIEKSKKVLQSYCQKHLRASEISRKPGRPKAEKIPSPGLKTMLNTATK